MKRTDIFSIIGIIITVGIFFWPVWQGKIPAPTDALVGLYHPWRDLYRSQYPRGVPFKNFLITDPIRQQIPWRKVAIDSWKVGMIPAWNPFNFSGASLVGNIQAAVFYPFNILFFLLNFPAAWTGLIIIQPLLAALFLYMYLRSNSLSPLSSLFSAVTWAFSGFMIAWLTWGTIVHVILWLPLILLSIDKLPSRKLVWSIVLMLALVCQFFAGHAQLSFYVLLLSGFYALWKRSKFFWVPLIISLVVTSIQWVPFVRTLLDSSRITTVDAWQTAGWFLPWQHLAQFLAPDFFGNPATLNYWGEWNYGEFIGYISIIGLIFSIFALLNIKKANVSMFWSIVLGVTLLFILPTPLAKIPYIAKIPILNSLQPTRLMAIIDLALVVLAAYGFELWRSRKGRIRAAFGLVGLGLATLWIVAYTQSLEISSRNLILPTALFGLTGLLLMLRVRMGQVVLIALVVFDLLRFGWKFIPFTPVEYFFPKTEAISFLETQEKPFRVMSVDSELLPPNVSAYYGIEDVGGYDPVYPARYEKFFASLTRGKPDISAPYGFNRILTSQSATSPLSRLLNVSYILSLRELDLPQLSIVFQEGSTRVYRVGDALPRAFLVSSVLKENDENAIFNMLHNSGFSPSSTALVEEDFNLTPSEFSQDDTVSIDQYASESMVLSVKIAVDRFLVISNMYDKGWLAAVDGASVPIHRANYLFMGIVVPSGNHSVTVQYH